MRKLLFESLFRRPFTEQAPSPDDAAVTELAAAVGRAARRRLGRSLSIREVDAGSCNGCELEIHALNNAYYDVERFGLRFVASPRHADVLMVTGPVTKNMRDALERTYHAAPNPKWVVAVGDCARDGGCFAGSYAVVGGVSQVVPVDLHIPGCPPPPTSDLAGTSRSARSNGQKCRFHLRLWGRYRLFQAGFIAACVQTAIVLVMTPLVILFAQYRDDDSGTYSRDPTLAVVSLLPLILVLAAGVALTKHRYVALTSTRIRHASRLMSTSEPDRTAGTLAICLFLHPSDAHYLPCSRLPPSWFR